MVKQKWLNQLVKKMTILNLECSDAINFSTSAFKSFVGLIKPVVALDACLWSIYQNEMAWFYSFEIFKRMFRNWSNVTFVKIYVLLF